MKIAIRSSGLAGGLFSLLLCVPVPARAGDGARGYCAARPGLGTTPCTIAPGRVSVEVAAVDWERDRAAGQSTDSVIYGNLAARVGVTDKAELFGAFTPFGTRWVRTPGAPVVRENGSGDVTLGGKLNLANPDGSGLSAATMAFVALPVGSRSFGAGNWFGGVLVPLSYALSNTFNLQLTPEVDIAVDSDGRGRHPAASIIGGAAISITRTLSVTGEMSIGRDYDPEEMSTQAFTALSVSYLPASNFQFDAGAVFGLNPRSPDARFLTGVSILF